MSRYVDLDKVKEVIFKIMSDRKVVHKHRALNRNIKQLPIADVAEMVRCKDCEEVVRCKDCEIATKDIMCDGWYYCNNNKMTHNPSHFCGYGKKRKE